jgi:uncharacterized protein
MRIGILSDSHGRAHTTRQAVAALLERGAELLLHLGDVGSEAVIDEFVGHNARLIFGNCDDDVRALTRYAEIMGLKVDHPLGQITIDGRTIAYTHGHLPYLLDQALAEGVDYVLHGHTHELRDEWVGRSRVINPGALFRASRYTAGLLDPARDALEIIDVPRS